MNSVRCAYAEGPIGKGKSHAWKIRGEDGAYYIVKFHTDNDHTAFNELLCAYLARLFQLPSLTPVLIEIDAGPIAEINQVRERSGLPHVKAGVHFGAKFTEPFFTVKSLVDKLGRNLTGTDIQNLIDVLGILMFDTLVQNNDRHCENVGVEPAAFGGQYEYKIFDHGHAFGGPSWKPEAVRTAYHNLPPIMNFCLVTADIDASQDFKGFVTQFEDHIEQWMKEFAGEIPEEWCPEAGQDLGVLLECLAGLEPDALERAVRKNHNIWNGS